MKYRTLRKVECDAEEHNYHLILTCLCSRCNGKYMIEIEEEEIEWENKD